jgi:hypothetical protein
LLERKQKAYNEAKRKQAKKFSVFFSAERPKPVQIGFCNGSFQIEANFYNQRFSVHGRLASDVGNISFAAGRKILPGVGSSAPRRVGNVTVCLLREMELSPPART